MNGKLTVTAKRCDNELWVFSNWKWQKRKHDIIPNSCKLYERELSLSFSLLIDSSEHQHKIHLNGARSANYHSIEWTQPRIDQLYTMYIQEPLSMQCNRSDGQRYDGRNWEGVPTTPVQIKIPIHRKLCPNYNPLWLKPLEKGECDLLGECIY